jgi:hypothetical protein
MKASLEIDTYAQSWKAQHEEVGEVLWPFEDHLAIGVALFRMVREQEEAWRDRILRGIQDFDPRFDEGFQLIYRCWLQPFREITQRLAQLEQAYGSVKHADEFRAACREIQDILRSWRPPALSTAIGLREMALNDQASTEVKDMLARAKARGPKTVETIPSQNSSFLRKPSN